MRTTSSKLSAAVLVVILSAVLVSTPASAMLREGPGRDDPPFVRVVKQILKKLGIMPNDEQPGVPHP